jgi:hypothetical protein
MSDAEQLVTAVTRTLILAYGLQPAEVTQIPVGTATVNYLVTDRSGGRWFARVYRDRTVLQRARDAVELAEFARAGDMPVPGVRRTPRGPRRTRSPNHWTTQARSTHPSRHTGEPGTRRHSCCSTGSTRSRRQRVTTSEVIAGQQLNPDPTPADHSL